MKLRELTEVNQASEQAKEYRKFFFDWSDNKVQSDAMVLDNGEVNPEGGELPYAVGFGRDHGTHELILPMKKEWFPPVDKVVIESIKSAIIIIPDFNEIPNAKVEIELWGAIVIKSFQGIEKNTITSFMLSEQTVVKCGLLRLLKMPNLKFVPYFGKDAKGETTELGKAMAIIRKHMKEKNIPECQQELIEEGFQQYAKL